MSLIRGVLDPLCQHSNQLFSTSRRHLLLLPDDASGGRRDPMPGVTLQYKILHCSIGQDRVVSVEFSPWWTYRLYLPCPSDGRELFHTSCTYQNPRGRRRIYSGLKRQEDNVLHC
ncbi:uncharacterized protein LOC123523384 [Mercenaria mercenaria]|uniref:uncharacterized protein LOC123523384 n=1 Tax=Mercenaria mercenaria TaxID=6596 RepID=UPI00234E561B|nr:uncharacterized protein LOC123523384 [Mercenaria mercenaria]